MQGVRRFVGVDICQKRGDDFCCQLLCVMNMDASVPVHRRVFMRKRALRS